MARLNKGVGFASVCLGFSLLANPLAYAEDTGEKWIAVSNTAMSITGDIELSPTAITMSTGSVLPLEAVKGDVPNLYRFTHANDLKLLRDNTFCLPHTEVGYVVLNYRGKEELEIDVFDGDEAPHSADELESQPGFCASYFYQKP
ncbi:hypothetical protein [Pseudovibrio sp. SCP19]|uniref:hypothetical protein n=1 Tax=Pseudovibrio sp. SCP19 TaxID=3141374 RepID=UPI0033354097